jgi:hypothetical protein
VKSRILAIGVGMATVFALSACTPERPGFARLIDGQLQFVFCASQAGNRVETSFHIDGDQDPIESWAAEGIVAKVPTGTRMTAGEAFGTFTTIDELEASPRNFDWDHVDVAILYLVGADPEIYDSLAARFSFEALADGDWIGTGDQSVNEPPC